MNYLKKMSEAFETGLAYAFIGIVTLVIGLFTVVIAPFAIAWVLVRNALGFGPAPISEDVLDEYYAFTDALQDGDIPFLELYAQSVPSFPDTADHLVGGHWLINAIDLGSLAAMAWVLDKCADVDFYYDDGQSPLHAAIQKDGENRLETVKWSSKMGLM